MVSEVVPVSHFTLIPDSFRNPTPDAGMVFFFFFLGLFDIYGSISGIKEIAGRDGKDKARVIR